MWMCESCTFSGSEVISFSWSSTGAEQKPLMWLVAASDSKARREGESVRLKLCVSVHLTIDSHAISWWIFIRSRLCDMGLYISFYGLLLSYLILLLTSLAFLFFSSPVICWHKIISPLHKTSLNSLVWERTHLYQWNVFSFFVLFLKTKHLIIEGYLFENRLFVLRLKRCHKNLWIFFLPRLSVTLSVWYSQALFKPTEQDVEFFHLM